ncbi:MAG: Gfo/Idh/MocA family oxidoreductase [Clostridia bacterium]|nr:Gfo/Idh/MocA family oxidoreductase [Clostridia bacterium]
MKKLNVAIIGQGRSGRNIHGAYFSSERNEYYNVAVIVELDSARRELAAKEYPGALVIADYRELFTMEDIDLVVNATFSNTHYSITKELLLAGRNVLVEKPMGATKYECEELLKISKEKGVLLAVFQQTFLAPYYLFAYELTKSGKIGDIKQINISYNNLARRWDWQTLQCRVAGSTFNTGPHPIGIALGFLDFDPHAEVVYSDLDSILCSGDSDDYSKILIKAPGKPLVDIEMISQDAYPEHMLKIIGTRGTFVTNSNDYKIKYIVDGENEERPVVFGALKDNEGMPTYCSEQLITHEESGKFDGTAFDIGTAGIYKQIYDNLTAGVPMTVTPEMASEVIRIIELVHAKSPLPVKYRLEA